MFQGYNYSAHFHISSTSHVIRGQQLSNDIFETFIQYQIRMSLAFQVLEKASIFGR